MKLKKHYVTNVTQRKFQPLAELRGWLRRQPNTYERLYSCVNKNKHPTHWSGTRAHWSQVSHVKTFGPTKRQTDLFSLLQVTGFYMHFIDIYEIRAYNIINNKILH